MINSTFTIALSSITLATKACSVLTKEGYECKIDKTPRTLANGCGYSVTVSGNISEITRILEGSRLVIRGVAEG